MSDNSEESHPLLSDLSSRPLPEKIQQVSISWKSLSFSMKSSSQTILNKLSGFANPKEILAIMGPSGSGKTTFLSLLSNRLIMEEDFEISGQIYLNQAPISSLNYNNIVRFIPQEAVLPDYLTPQEYLSFQLNLRTQYSEEEIKARVQSILKELRIDDVQNTVIGNLILRGLSGGEKKRLCIASELMYYPSVLIIDEPLSGLDSFNAMRLMNILNDIKESGVSIIMSVHQPGSLIFRMFDRLILMQEGRFVYQGKTADSIKYFTDIGFDINRTATPDEVYMKILRIEDRFQLSEEEIRVVQVLDMKYLEKEESILKEITLKTMVQEDLIDTIKRKSYFFIVKMILMREYTKINRDPFTLKLKFANCLAFIVLGSILYFNLGYDSNGILHRYWALSGIVYQLFFIAGNCISVSSAMEKPTILKELKENLYELHHYFLARILVEILFEALVNITMIFSIYYVINLNNESIYKVLILSLVGFIIQIQSIGLGLFCGILFGNPTTSRVMTSMISIFFVMFAGIFSNPESGPSNITWLKLASPLYFLRNAIMKNEFSGLDYDEDVVPCPEKKYNIRGEILENVLYSCIHLFLLFLSCYLAFRYEINRIEVHKRIENNR